MELWALAEMEFFKMIWFLFLSPSRQGLDFAGHTTVGDATLGFNAAVEIRSDAIQLNTTDTRLRYINCPESPFIDGTDQNICAGL